MILWRLIISPPSDGATNMAIDEALFKYSDQPTLRFYSWSSPTLSLGYFQKEDPRLINKCKENGIDVVRRPTGGRAVLHDNEITYSVVSSYENFPKPSTLKGIYKALAQWQVASFETIGLKTTLSDGVSSRQQNYVTNDACFLTPIQSEVLVKGKKICGSAQKRGNDSFLQHGSIPVDLNEQQFLNITGEREKALDAFTTLKKEGYEGTAGEFIALMSRKFEEVLRCKLISVSISDSEMKKTFSLKKENYDKFLRQVNRKIFTPK